MQTEKAALAMSTISLLISFVSLLESDMNRRLSERTAIFTEATDKANRRLTETLSRPWVTIAAVTLAGTGNNVKGIAFTFKNSGSSPALKLEMAPALSWTGSDPIDLDFAEKNGAMPLGTLPQNEQKELLMSIDSNYLTGFRHAIHAHETVTYGVQWKYEDVHGNKHQGMQKGHWEPDSQMFTDEENKVE